MPLGKIVKKALDMSHAARMKRAQEQGYETGWHHATKSDFDPEKSGSANLLAGVGGMGVIGALGASEDAEAAPFGTLAKKLGIATREAWHGSPHKFDRFTTTRMGTGEGNQAQGWGIYLSGKKEVAEDYSERLSHFEPTYKGRVMTPDMSQSPQGEAAYELASYYLGPGLDKNEALEAFLLNKNIEVDRHIEWAASALDPEEKAKHLAEAERIESVATAAVDIDLGDVSWGDRYLYNAEVPASESLLDYGSYLHDQPEPVLNALSSVLNRPNLVSDMREAKNLYERMSSGLGKKGDEARLKGLVGDLPKKGFQLYDDLSASLGGDKQASMTLRDAGIPGHRYTGDGSGAENFVIYDEEAVNAVSRNSNPLPIIAGGAIGASLGLPEGAEASTQGFANERLSNAPTGPQVKPISGVVNNTLMAGAELIESNPVTLFLGEGISEYMRYVAQGQWQPNMKTFKKAAMAALDVM